MSDYELLDRLRKELELPYDALNDKISLNDSFKIRGLNLSSLELHNLPDCISDLKNLETLGLHYNKLTSLPESITKLDKLQHLCIRNNQLTNIPAEIGQLKQLTYLDLEWNKLTSLPDGMKQLTNLQELDLGRNQLTNVPDAIAQLNNLQKLNLNYNNLNSLPEILCKRITKSNITVLAEYNNFKSITTPNENHFYVLNPMYLQWTQYNNMNSSSVFNVMKLDANELTQLLKQYSNKGINLEFEDALKIFGKITDSDVNNMKEAIESSNNPEIIKYIMKVCPQTRWIIEETKKYNQLLQESNITDCYPKIETAKGYNLL